jgi:cobalamin biosynthetic protein CobC
MDCNTKKFNVQDSGQHGGNLSQINAIFPYAPRPFIDLSTGINPYPYPLPHPPKGGLHRLADEVEMLAACTATANYYGTNLANIHLGAGMQPLLFAIAAARFQKFGKAKVAILSPTYSEYAKIWQAAGHEISLIDNFSELNEYDVAIICNPNNPDGWVIPHPKLLTIANDLSIKNGWLIIDEAFADFLPENSMAKAVEEMENLVVLRSIGKFFGLAGLRVSVAITPSSWEAWLQIVLGSWPITTSAALQLPAMFANNGWVTQTRIQLAKEAETWREILTHHFTIIGHTPLFTLVECENAPYWYNKLAAQGILVRKFSYNNKWLRFGLPHNKDLDRIITTLSTKEK